MPSDVAAGSTIVLVDDDEILANLLSACLRKAGHGLAAFSDSREALRFLREAAASIRLLVSDVDMPYISGLELAEAARHCGCPVLLISGKPLPGGIQQKGWKFLPKPFTPAVLLQNVEEILADSTTRRQPARPRLILAEDDAEVRRRLCALIGEEYEIVAALEDGPSVIEKARELHPEIILLDIGMPGMNGFAVARILRSSIPDVPLLFVTQHADPAYVAEALSSGVAGYVLKRNLVKELTAALQEVRAGGRYVSPGLRAA